MYIDKHFIENNFPSVFEETKSSTKSIKGDSVQEGYNDNAQAAFSKIERLLSVRDRSIVEATERLQRDRFTEKAIKEALDRSLRCGYLDDMRFADGFIRSRLRASKGIEGIVRDLKAHHIDPYVIPGFPDVYLEEQGSQLANAIHLLNKKPPRAKNIRQAAYAKLIRNGFSSAVASSAVKAWHEKREQDMHFT